MIGKLYDHGSSPTQRQIMQAVLDYKGNCGAFIRRCIPVARTGDYCPMFREEKGCICHVNRTSRVSEARKWFMESTL